MDSSSENLMGGIWSGIWKLNVPNKIKHFIWKALNRYLPTRDNLRKRGMEVIPICPWCEKEVESIDHVLFLCQRAASIWSLVWNKELSRVSFNSYFVDHWISLSSSYSREEIKLIKFGCWTIWLDRNKITHDLPVPNSEVRSRWILNYVDNFVQKSSGLRGLLLSQPSSLVSGKLFQQSPPPVDFLKLNVDASWSSLAQATGCGV